MATVELIKSAVKFIIPTLKNSNRRYIILRCTEVRLLHKIVTDISIRGVLNDSSTIVFDNIPDKTISNKEKVIPKMKLIVKDVLI